MDGSRPSESLCQAVFLFFDDPSSSGPAACWGIIQMVLIIATAACAFVQDYGQFDQAIFAIEIVAIYVFSFDYAVRLITCPDFNKFVFDWLSLIDLISIAPFFLLYFYYQDVEKAASYPSTIIRCLRFMRFVKMIKFIHLLSPPKVGRRQESRQRGAQLDIEQQSSAEKAEVKNTTRRPKYLHIESLEGYNFPIAHGEFKVTMRMADTHEVTTLDLVTDEAGNFVMPGRCSLRCHRWCRNYKALDISIEATGGTASQFPATLSKSIDIGKLGLFRRPHAPPVEVNAKLPGDVRVMVSLSLAHEQ